MKDYKRLTYRDTEYNDPMYKRLQDLENGIEDYQVLILPDNMPKDGTAVEHSALFWKKSWERSKKTCGNLTDECNKWKEKYNSAECVIRENAAKIAAADDVIQRFSLTDDYNRELKEFKERLNV